jgi:beta-N-acetylhexosaminidase
MLCAQEFAPLRDKRVGLMTNPSAVDRQLTSTYDILRQNVQLTALFAPEHGILGASRDGEFFDSMADARTGIPIYSLYGETFRPTSTMLDGIDVLVCDIQDIGARFYTFWWTVSLILEAAGEYGVSVLILDRPNPIGERVAGPGIAPELRSLVGRFPIPIQHGMTLGELALMLNALWNTTPAHVEVVRCEDWQRALLWEQTGLPFVPPSPAMAHLVTARHYPGACLLEGTTLSEGRGTALPFEIMGAPYIDALALAEHLNAQNWEGVRFRSHAFRPTASKYAGEDCFGVQAHITDIAAYAPLPTWLGVIREIRQLYPHDFGWRSDHFDRLMGDTATRMALDDGATLTELTAHWSAFEQDFMRLRAPYLLY